MLTCSSWNKYAAECISAYWLSFWIDSVTSSPGRKLPFLKGGLWSSSRNDFSLLTSLSLWRSCHRAMKSCSASGLLGFITHCFSLLKQFVNFYCKIKYCIHIKWVFIGTNMVYKSYWLHMFYLFLNTYLLFIVCVSVGTCATVSHSAICGNWLSPLQCRLYTLKHSGMCL